MGRLPVRREQRTKRTPVTISIDTPVPARRGPHLPQSGCQAPPISPLGTDPDRGSHRPDPNTTSSPTLISRTPNVKLLKNESGRADVDVPLGRFGLHAGVPIGPARSAPARGSRGEAPAARQGPRPPPSLPRGVPVDDDLGRSGGALVRGSSGPCSQSARDASASCWRWRRRDSRVTAARSGEVRGAQWSEMDTKADVWAVPPLA